VFRKDSAARSKLEMKRDLLDRAVEKTRRTIKGKLLRVLGGTTGRGQLSEKAIRP